ncbi:MAG: poly(3-hydroxybutyrate) depolymerase [Zoogloeaceae bacterium]|jgi:poly(3-hydroxybutyrate) depolymerase|nr:poly(3-hydroxybutyrate) depolymerase [Zoogloeaceae bacterium]
MGSSKVSRFLFLLAQPFVAAFPAFAAEPLPTLAASLENLTVSGLSSGGFMAVQFHIAHSSLVRGAGVLAAGPYYCAQGNASLALSACMSPSFFVPVPELKNLIREVHEQARKKHIDAPEALQNSRVWIFSGERDRTVKREVVNALYTFYRTWLPDPAVHYEKHPEAGHAMIAPDAPGAHACSASSVPFINRCDDFDAPGRLFAHLLGELKPPAAKDAGDLVVFDQSVFTNDGAGMASNAYVYIPSDCRQGGCRIHVAFHGCRQQGEVLGSLYAKGAGYNRWAESNRLIVLYPQTAKSSMNPNGCWDWWGYTGPDYHLASARQIRAVKAMVEHLARKKP